MRLLVVGCALLVGASGVAYAEPTLDQLLQSDRAEFAREAPNFYKSLRKHADPQTIQDSETSLRQRAKALLLEVNIGDLSLEEARALGYFALPSMSPEERALLDERLSDNSALLHDLSLEELQAQLALESGIADGAEFRDRRRELAASWLQGRDLSMLSKDDLIVVARLLAEGTQPLTEFSVVWSGQITAPRSGEYRFSISPHDMNVSQYEDEVFVENLTEATLVVGEGTVLESTPDDWSPQGDPVSLVAQSPTAIEFKLHGRWKNDHIRMTPAILYWEGPGLPRSVVPAAAFSRSGSAGPGLEAVYSWDEKAGSGSVARRVETTDPNIEFVWPTRLETGLREDAIQRVSNELVARWTQPDGDFVGDVARWQQITSLLSTTQLERCLESLLDSPAQLEDISASRMERFLYGARCGAEETVVDVVGVWMTKRSYLAPTFAMDSLEHFDLNREFFFRIAEFFAFEYPDGMTQLEERHLVGESGECRLNVASALAECYLAQGRIDEWIAKLKDHLSTPEAEGGNRVDWLIARAQAEDFRSARATRYYRTPERLLAGREWLDEATLVAETADQQLRVANERLTRFATLGLWEAAQDEIEDAQSRSGHAGGILAEWSSRLDELKDRAEASDAHGKSATIQAYIAEIERRREKASTRGDDVNFKRYSSMLTELRKGDSQPTE